MPQSKPTKWKEPVAIRSLLENCFTETAMPPHSPSVYVISKKPWRGKPKKEAELLYVGGMTSKNPRFRGRIGDFIADIFGFFNDAENPKTRKPLKLAHHSGGMWLHEYCGKNPDALLSPFGLYIGWAEATACHRCLECEVYQEFEQELIHVRGPNWKGKRPARCGRHGGRGKKRMKR